MLTETGYITIQEILDEYAVAKVTRRWIDDNIDMLKNAWHDPADFYEEANSKGMYDTCQREILVDAFAKFLIGMEWPLYGDSDEYAETFRRKYYSALIEQNMLFPT